MKILEKYLGRLGVKSFTELTAEERETYRTWEAALNGKKLTDQDVVTFFFSEEDRIMTALIDCRLNERLDAFYKAELDIIRRLKAFLLTPEIQKKMTEQNINNLISK